MKKFKKGFTLAEVLITLAIIGIVAAIVMPSVILNYQTKTLGIKLAKFAGSIENSARAYVASDASLVASNPTSINDFLREALVVKNMYRAEGYPDKADINTRVKGFVIKGLPPMEGLTNIGIANENPENGGNADNGATCKTYNEDGTACTEYYDTENAIAVLKDNTRLMVYPVTSQDTADWSSSHTINTTKVGEGAFVITFDPNVSGLAGSTHKAFDFVVTEFGFVFPSSKDKCLWSIVNNDWTSTTELLKQNACITTSET